MLAGRSFRALDVIYPRNGDAGPVRVVTLTFRTREDVVTDVTRMQKKAVEADPIWERQK